MLPTGTFETQAWPACAVGRAISLGDIRYAIDIRYVRSIWRDDKPTKMKPIRSVYA